MTQHKHPPEIVGVHEKAATNTGIVQHTDLVIVTFLYYQMKSPHFSIQMLKVHSGAKLNVEMALSKEIITAKLR